MRPLSDGLAARRKASQKQKRFAETENLADGQKQKAKKHYETKNIQCTAG